MLTNRHELVIEPLSIEDAVNQELPDEDFQANSSKSEQWAPYHSKTVRQINATCAVKLFLC